MISLHSTQPTSVAKMGNNLIYLYANKQGFEGKWRYLYAIDKRKLSPKDWIMTACPYAVHQIIELKGKDGASIDCIRDIHGVDYYINLDEYPHAKIIASSDPSLNVPQFKEEFLKEYCKKEIKTLSLDLEKHTNYDETKHNTQTK